MKHSCENCKFLKEQDWNMVRAKFYSCDNGVKYGRMFKDNCDLFEPTVMACNTQLLKEIYENEIVLEKSLSTHRWTIVDDMTKSDKRISGNNNFFLKFNSESELDNFYNKHKELIDKSTVRA